MKFKYNYILVIFALIFSAACDTSSSDKIIEREKFIDILVDVHFSDAVISERGFYDGNLKDSTKSYYHYILKKHNITRISFDNSIKYYSKNGEEYLKIYDEVIAKISKRIPIVFLHKESIYTPILRAIDKIKKDKGNSKNP